MANDRIYFRCQGCKAELRIWKYYPDGGGYNESAEFDADWFRHHLTKCHPRYGRDDLGGIPGFEFCVDSDTYENTPDEMKSAF